MDIVANIVFGCTALAIGVHCIGKAFESKVESKIRHWLENVKFNTFKAFLVSIVITMLLQSSTAVTVITVGLVNSNIFSLETAMGIIYGANIGTTITAQLMSLDVSQYGLAAILAGAITKVIFLPLWFFNNEYENKYVSAISVISSLLIGTGLILSGIRVLNHSVPFIQNNELIATALFAYGTNAFAGFIFGLCCTVMIQSSAAITGMTIAMYGNGLIGQGCSVGVVLGSNVGTCVTAIVASIGANASAKQTAWAHMIYNLIGAVVVFLLLNQFMELVIMLTPNKGMFVANAHTLFNVISALVFLPFNKFYVQLINKWFHLATSNTSNNIRSKPYQSS